MNILLVSGPGISLKQPYQSGIESFIVLFANQLTCKGHKVDVVAAEADADAKFNLLNPFDHRSTDELIFYKQIKEAHQFINLPLDAYDVVHYNMYYPHLIEVGMHHKANSFLTLHSPADTKRVSFFKELSEHSKLILVAISARIKLQYDRALSTHLPIINNGINLDNWRTATERKPKYLLWSARITKEKNVVAAIRLAQSMRVALKIAGRIVDQEYFQKEVKPHLNGQIQYVGHVKQQELKNLAQNTYAYMATATWQEPFGLAALEMLASGVPVVGFNTAVPQEWQHESVLTTASLRWQDLPALVKKSEAISPETCREFASHMSIDKMTSSYIELYGKVLLSSKVARQQDEKEKTVFNRLKVAN